MQCERVGRDVGRMAEKLSDILTYALSLALAGTVLAFAAYKVVALNGMENPPANLGLNFPPLKPRVITDGGLAADPLITRSITPAGVQPARGGEGGGPAGGSAFAYELLTVVDGVAFVAVDSPGQKTLVPVSVGTRLPGGPVVNAIGRKNGRWRLVAGDVTLDQSLAPPQ